MLETTKNYWKYQCCGKRKCRYECNKVSIQNRNIFNVCIESKYTSIQFRNVLWLTSILTYPKKNVALSSDYPNTTMIYSIARHYNLGLLSAHYPIKFSMNFVFFQLTPSHFGRVAVRKNVSPTRQCISPELRKNATEQQQQHIYWGTHHKKKLPSFTQHIPAATMSCR